jgi:intracellular multiplication protein IcmM
MSIGKYQNQKNSRYFYVRSYRLAVQLILILNVLNLILFLMAGHFFYQQPERGYYSSNGVTFPVKLSPLRQPNYESQALLPDDIPMEKAVDFKL